MRHRLSAMFMSVVLIVLASTESVFASDDRFSIDDSKVVLRQYAVDTWESFKAMTDPVTGLPSDSVSDDRARDRKTSPTNIGLYLWSTLVARDLGIITPRQARTRVNRVLQSLAEMERHADSGQFYNWYDPATGEKLRVWPETGDPISPFISSVDNAWLASALIMVSKAMPRLRDQALEILNGMDFSCFYNPDARGSDIGLMRGGFWKTEDAPDHAVNFTKGNYCGKGPDVVYTGHHYDILNTETRIVSYIAIALGQVPPAHYFATYRTFPNDCGWSWQESAPQGVTRAYLGLDVFEGAYTHLGQPVLPSWGGSMFEALMPSLIVPEVRWGPQSWALNHPAYVKSQIAHGMEEAAYGYWGFSPSRNPEAGGYREWGVDGLGMWDMGYTSDEEGTKVDLGYLDLSGGGYCRGREPQPLPDNHGRGVVTPHAAFLALELEPSAALENLYRLRTDFDAYGWGGFYDAVGVRSGAVAKDYLALDQGMIMAAIGNALLANRLKTYFSSGAVQRALQPLLAQEQFGLAN